MFRSAEVEGKSTVILRYAGHADEIVVETPFKTPHPVDSGWIW